MAIFNPDVPEVGPGNYLKYSQPVSDVEANKSKAILVKGVGEMIETGVKGTEDIIKAYVAKDVRDIIEPERDSYTKALEAGRNIASHMYAAGNPATATDASGIDPITGNPTDVHTRPLDILSSHDAPVPADIKKLPAQLENLTNARNANKITETDYHGRMSMLAKDIRSRYPVGYRDYIDNEISKVTGVDPANAYIHGLVRDINSFMGGSGGTEDKETEKWLAWAKTGNHMGIPGMDKMYQRLRNKEIGPDQFASFAADQMREVYRIETEGKAVKHATDLGAAGKDEARRAAGVIADSTSQQYLNNILHLEGMETPKKLNDIIIAGLTGKTVLNAQQYEQLANGVRGYQRAISADIDADFAKRGLTRVVDKEELNKIKAATLEPWIAMEQAFRDNNSGLAFQSARAIAASKRDEESALWNDKDVGRFIRLQSAFKGLGLEDYTKDFFIHGLKEKYGEKWQMKIDSMKMELAAPPDVRVPKTFDSLYGAVKDVEKNEKALGVKVPETYQQLFSMIDGKKGLTDPNTPAEVKRAIIHNFFNPENRKLMAELTPDAYDSKGNRIPGKQALWQRMAKEDVVAEVAKMDAKSKEQYVDMMRTWYNYDIFKMEVDALKNPNFMTQLTGKYEMAWDNEAHIFTINIGGQKAVNLMSTAGWASIPGVHPEMVGTVSRTINRLNDGIKHMSNLSKLTPADPNAFVLQLLRNEGVDMTNVKGLPEAMAEAIRQANKDKAEEEKEKQEKERSGWGRK